MSMNERNVEALTNLIGEMSPGHSFGLLAFDDVARYLASRGVLEPSVLTDEDCRDLPEYRSETTLAEPEEVWANLRAALARIARGDW